MNEYERKERLRRRLPELLELEELSVTSRLYGDVTIEDQVCCGELKLPIYSFGFGAKDSHYPRIAFVGGVHGLERIGTNVAIAFLKAILGLMQWDAATRHLLARCRLLFLPLVNPGGMYARSRANPHGVDLMRNAPLEAETRPNVLLVGGQRLSSVLPWYRGRPGAAMEREARVLATFVRRELFSAPFSLALDLHSGFGMVDRLWFPFAYTRRPFDHIDAMSALRTRLTASLPHHVYVMEPQAQQYVTHGDLWDWLFLEHRQEQPTRRMLPLTLEMGSWLWVKKNPWQAFSSLGVFNPILPHRLQRTLRRHTALLDFLLRATAAYEAWADPDRMVAEGHKERALALWYGAKNN